MDSQPPPPTSPTFVWVAVLMGVLVLAVQAILVFIVLDTRSGVNAVSEDLRDVELRLAGAPLDGLEPATTTTTGDQPASTASAATTAPAGTATPPTTGPNPLEELPSSEAPEFEEAPGGLPQLESNTVADPAVGMTLGSLAAVEWEQGDVVEIDLADGTARAIVVFAHWCPSCQEMMPQLAEWQESLGADLENMELVTVASAVDGESDVTVAEYLSEQGFPFPVFVDSGNEIAGLLGVNAFPFWVFVSPEGDVIGRIAGSLPPVQFQTLFTDLDEIGADG